MDFWPEGLSIKDMRSPRQIILEANEDWVSKSEGVLTLGLEEAVTDNSGNSSMNVFANNTTNHNTIVLFKIHQRVNLTYPVAIQLREEDLPNHLKKSYYSHSVKSAFGQAGAISQMFGEGQLIKNEWVSDTPTEFRKHLEKALNTSYVKRAILSLFSDEISATSDDVSSK